MVLRVTAVLHVSYVIHLPCWLLCCTSFNFSDIGNMPAATVKVASSDLDLGALTTCIQHTADIMDKIGPGSAIHLQQKCQHRQYAYGMLLTQGTCLELVLHCITEILACLHVTQ